MQGQFDAMRKDIADIGPDVAKSTATPGDATFQYPIPERIEYLPDRLAGVIAAESDQTKVHTLLTREIHQNLVALTS